MKNNRTVDTIRDHDTICSLFGSNNPDRPRIYEKIKDDPVYKKFNEWTKKLQFLGWNSNIPVGEISLLIYRVYGYDWDEIPFGRYDEIYMFVRNNVDIRYKWIAPEMHEELLKTNYYKTSSTLVDKKATSIFMSNLYSMMEAGRPQEEFKQLGIEVLK